MKRTWVFLGLMILVAACQPVNGSQGSPANPSGTNTIEQLEPIIEVILPTALPLSDVNLPDKTEISAVEFNQYYVAVDGSASGTGAIDDPWDLQTALNHPSVVKPGDIIWLRGGIYLGQFKSHLKGEEDYRIVVRQVPGERAILSDDGLMLDIQDTWYVDFWGFEITCLNNTRDPENRPLWGFGIRTHQGNHSHHIRFINMFIHDVHTQGLGWWITNTDSELYGSLIFYNGVNQLDHGVYVKNQEGTKTIQDNFIFDNASHGIHAYSSEEDTLNNLVIIGNTVFNNGSIGYSTRKNVYGNYERNILVGGYNQVKNPIIEDNYTYYPGAEGESFNLGYRVGSINSRVSGNYLMGGGLTIGGIAQQLTFEDNTIYSPGLGVIFKNSYPMNTYYQNKPAQTMIFIRQNLYDDQRANITIYNWEGKDEVFLDQEILKDLPLSPGVSFQLHNVQDYYGDILSGVYDGKGVKISMVNHSVQPPIGLDFSPASTFPEFGAFVLIIGD